MKPLARTMERLLALAERLDPTRETVTLRAEKQLVLECGEASITLNADGRIVIRGGYIETHADGTNRIKGGSVRIN